MEIRQDLLSDEELFKQANVFEQRGDDSQAKVIWQKLHRRLVHHYGHDDLDALAIGCNLGNTMKRLGELAQAEELQRQAVRGFRQKGLYDVWTLEAMNNLAGTLCDKHDLEGAEQMHRETLTGRRQAMGGSHARTLQSVANLARVLLDLDRASEAESLIRQVCESSRDALRSQEQRKEYAQMRHVLGNALSVQGRHDEACGVLETSVRVLRQIAGNRDDATLNAIHGLTRVHCRRDRPDLMEGMLQEVLNARLEKHGEDHRETARAKHDLGEVKLMLGDTNAAMALFREALRVREKTLGALHPETVRARYSIAFTLEDQYEHDAARRAFQAVYEQSSALYGATHPGFLTAKYALASVLQSSGQLAESELMYRQVLQTRQEAPGGCSTQTRSV